LILINDKIYIVRLPALRERPKDIPLLVEFFINNLKEIYNRPAIKVSNNALKWLKQLPLPGNIRQLKNIVERSVSVSRKDVLEAEDFKFQLEQSPGKKGVMQLPQVGTITLDELETEMIKKAMDFHKNKVSKAASALGITRSSLYRRLEKFDIPYDETED